MGNEQSNFTGAGTLSYDFCDVIRKQFLQTDVKHDDPKIWKTLFCTEMSDTEIMMYLNWNSVRLMRRNRPQNLASLAYRSMQQLVAFLDKATLPGATIVTSEAGKEKQKKTQAQKQAEEGESKEKNSSSSETASASATTSASVSVPQKATVARESVVDPCSALNAIRILIQILPVIFELDIKVEQTVRPSFLDDEDDVGPTQHPQKGYDDLVDKLLAEKQSPFADKFGEHFFEHNLKCLPSSPHVAFPPLFAENQKRANESGWDKNKASPDVSTVLLPVSLADELVVVLTRLCFIPGFSVHYGAVSTSAMRYLRGYSPENAQCGSEVIEELLDLEGLFRRSNKAPRAAASSSTATASSAASSSSSSSSSSTKNKNNNNNPLEGSGENLDKLGEEEKQQQEEQELVVGGGGKIFNTLFSHDVLYHRMLLLRCLLSCLSKNAMIGRSIASSSSSLKGGTDVFRACFQDHHRNPLALTLLISLFNFVCTYDCRGVLPYTSHYWVEMPEKLLSVSIELVCTVLTFPPDCCLLDEVPSASSSSSSSSLNNETNNNNNNNKNKGTLNLAYPLSSVDYFLASANRSRHSLWTSLSKILSSEFDNNNNNNNNNNKLNAADFIVSGLVRILANPVYASTTALRGSQRVMEKSHEACTLLWFLCVCPGTQSAVLHSLARVCFDSAANPSKYGDAYALMGLLRIVLRGLQERRNQADAQCALWILFLLSATPVFPSSSSSSNQKQKEQQKEEGEEEMQETTTTTASSAAAAAAAASTKYQVQHHHAQGYFAGALRMPLAPGMCPLRSLENLDKSQHATLGDALVLALCEISCPSAPRWLLPMSELSTAILANTVPKLRLLEITQFEVFHLLEWITGAFLSVQRQSVSQDACLLAVVDLVLNSARISPEHCKPLVASLATDLRISDRLRKILDGSHSSPSKNQQQEEEEGEDDNNNSSVMKIAPVYKAGDSVRQNLPFNDFCHLEQVAVEKMEKSSSSSKTSASSTSGADDPYKVLDEAIPYFQHQQKEAGEGEEHKEEEDYMLRSMQPSMELLRWGVATAWAVVVQSNMRTPVFDVSRSKMFSI